MSKFKVGTVEKNSSTTMGPPARGTYVWLCTAGATL